MQSSKASINRKNSGDALLTDSNKIFSLVRSISTDFPVPGLEDALGLIPGLVEGIMETRAHAYQKQKTMKQIKEFLDLLKSVGDSIVTRLENENLLEELGSIDEFQKQVKSIESKLAAVLRFVQNHRRTNWWPNLLFQNQDELLADIEDKIDNIKEDFKSEEGSTILQLATDMERINLSGIYYQTSSLCLTQILAILDGLRPADASFTSALSKENKYLTPGTRVSVLQHLNEWVHMTNSSRRIYVLHGRAGTGKSTVAHTFCRSLDSTHLGASFFFVRGSEECSDPYCIFPTLAFQLAHSKPELCRFVVTAVKVHTQRGAGRQQLRYQYQDLIAKVLSRTSKPLLIVLDGVDECLNKPDNIIPDLLKQLCTAAQDYQHLRVLITTRPERYIMNVLESSEFSEFTVFRDLGLEEDVDRDIALYIKSYLAENSENGLSLAENGADAVENLTRFSEGLFLHTSSVIQFLTRAGHLARRFYDDLVQSQGQGGPCRMYEKLDGLYSTILKIAFEDVKDDEKCMEQVQRVLRWLALYRFQGTVGYPLHEAPYLSPEQLEFVGIPLDITLYVMDRLRSILIIEGRLTPATKLRVSHPSFARFLVDPKRCQDPLFNVRLEDGHQKIALNLLELLGRGTAAALLSDAYKDMLEYSFFELPRHLERIKVLLTDDVRVALHRYLKKCLEGAISIHSVVSCERMALIPECFISLRESCKTIQAGAEIDALLDNITQI